MFFNANPRNLWLKWETAVVDEVVWDYGRSPCRLVWKIEQFSLEALCYNSSDHQHKGFVSMSIYSIRLYLEPNESGVYTVTSPDIPGLVTEGRTPEDIQANVQDALRELQAAWNELGLGLPPVLRPALKDRPQTIDLLVTA